MEMSYGRGPKDNLDQDTLKQVDNYMSLANKCKTDLGLEQRSFAFDYLNQNIELDDEFRNKITNSMNNYCRYVTAYIRLKDPRYIIYMLDHSDLNGIVGRGGVADKIIPLDNSYHGPLTSKEMFAIAEFYNNSSEYDYRYHNKYCSNFSKTFCEKAEWLLDYFTDYDKELNLLKDGHADIVMENCSDKAKGISDKDNIGEL